MKNLDLKELIFKIAESQDKASFNTIFDYFSPRIMGYLTSSGTNRAISEEITQEVLSAVWQKAYQFDQKVANVSTWIFTIARNKRIDRVRKNENPYYNLTDLLDSLYSNNSAHNEEIKSEVDVILSTLSEDEQKLLKMNFFEGKSHKAISKETNAPLGTIKSRIRSILNKIRDI
jgi:RNA polymerase sigma-70 factor (ECF subfamily)